MQITRRIEFDAGHRLIGHEGKCRHLHGHRYAAEITVMSDCLDSVGRVVDFGLIKTVIGGWIDANWDHNLLLHENDPLLTAIDSSVFDLVFGDAHPFVMPRNENPTAENMAQFLLNKSIELLGADPGSGLEVVKVRLYETPSCWADVTNWRI